VSDDRPRTPGLHHLTGFVGDPRPAVAFYTATLGLRLVKRTVNFEDRFVHHLYFGDDRGSPGSLVTGFAYPHVDPGRVGVPQPTDVALAIPRGTADDWETRLADRGVETERTTRFGDAAVRLADPDGGPVSLVERPVGDRPPATDTVPADRAVRCLHGVTLRSTNPFHTAATLEVLGFALDAQEGDRVRYRVPDGGERGTVVDVLDADGDYGREGPGTLHHLAVRAGDRSLADWRDGHSAAGLEPTWIKDRRYFRSVYARGPGGILFEVATDDPGPTVDESVAKLGSGLCLPPQFEADRAVIEEQLPPL
jgi:glyoxalase family protein